MYDPNVECTVPAQVAALAETAEEIVEGAPADGASLGSLESHAEEAAAAVAAALAVEELLDGDRSRFPLVAFTLRELDDVRRVLTSTSAELDEATRRTQGAIAAEEERIAEEEARRAAEEEARRAAEEEARRAAEEEARRAAEQEARRAAEEEARRAAEQQRQQEAQRSEQTRRSSSGSGSSSGSSGSSSGSSGGYDGYTGCRAYGGKYPPNAVDEKGRSYTKIDCTTKTPIG